jgi:hypothetical protein
MQLTPRYLVSNLTKLRSNESGFIVEYRPVYSRQLQVFKGIDNVLDFRLYNADQRPIPMTNYTPKFVAYDENKVLVIEKDGVVQDDGSSEIKGKFSVTITENELLNIKQQFLSYNIYLVDADSNKVLTYNHSNFDNDATIYVNAKTFPGPLATYQVTQFEQTEVGTDQWISETIDAQPGINGNEALHTAAAYTSSYIGNIVVQATLDNQVTESTNWADIATMTFSGTETEPLPVNFNGVFSHLRFKTNSNPADKITKILVRN